ncbi:unnamed protein product (macronuclear) [Paramecium tetraurelia]|uniref:Protein kinase domain-containing protein n=1 Tax=Paramecium tetraurelia TaxID=5888 RepID=A0C1J7_PARTE|nr:uncharacterized protein GSPATT00034141001 [Paramecium tetraurelia]CAK64664.1 unnamed protein product [Paramecium tetraurelia]|eukprot:XP_001432061.1 hypothetical protein (macronuclear) [Paramecium tetraurelia strain d4-2]
MNNSQNESKKSEQTQTIDYFQQLNENRCQLNNNVFLLERTIFQLLRKYPDVFSYNQQQIHNVKNGCLDLNIENGLLLGQGAYGSVYSTINPNNNLPAALKVQVNCDFDQVIILAEEFQIQKRIAVHFPECIIQIQNKIVISLQYMNAYRIYAYLDLGLGNLKEYQLRLKQFTELQFNNLFDCILDSVLKIHSLKIAHNDIKLENIINTQKNGWVLADFGCSTQYITPYGEYPIVGTRAYMQKQVRGALNNNLKIFKMNLFKKDIYAFQLSMLQILYPQDNINVLQQILDQQKMVHPKINSLYNKDYFQIKSYFLQQKYIRTTLIQEPIIASTEDVKRNLENNFKLSLQYKIHQSTQNLSYNGDMKFWMQCMLNIISQEYSSDQEIIRKVMILDSFVDKYSCNVSAQEIFEEISIEDLSKFEYDLYYDVLEKKGQRMLQLMLCQGYQATLAEPNCNLKFQEAELLYIIGQWEQAKEAINSIQNELELENDEMLLKFICLKSRLNGQWIKAIEEIIPYLINYKEMIQIMIEWKFIIMDSIWLNKSKNMLNKIYQPRHNFNSQEKKDTVELDFSKYIKIFYQCEGEERVAFGVNVINMMQNLNYDKYAIFQQGWTYCEIMQYHCVYQSFIEQFIQFIEQNLEGYYFNWAIYDCYSQFLVYKGEFIKAKHYLDKAMKIVENDCIYNQFTLSHHLFQLQFQLGSLEYAETFRKMIDFLNQMGSSELTLYLFAILFQETLNSNHQYNSQSNIRDFLSQAAAILKGHLIERRLSAILCYIIEEDYAFRNKDFIALKSAMWNELPKALKEAEDQQSHEEEVLIGFSELFQIAEFEDLNLKDETRYTSRWIQSVIIFGEIGFQNKKLPKHVAGFVPYFYSVSCSRSGDQRKYQEAQELYAIIHMNASWLF